MIKFTRRVRPDNRSQVSDEPCATGFANNSSNAKIALWTGCGLDQAANPAAARIRIPEHPFVHIKTVGHGIRLRQLDLSQ